MRLFTYLNYGGNCRQAFRFYEQHLGGKITMMMTHGEQPDPAAVPPGWEDAILLALYVYWQFLSAIVNLYGLWIYA